MYLCAKSTKESEPNVAEREGEILVKKVSEEFGHAIIGPSAVDKKQSFKKSELSDRVVRGKNGLQALLSADTNADMRRFNHRHVVCAVADCQRHR